MEVPQPPNLRKRRSEAVLGDDEKERQQEIQDDRAIRAEILEAQMVRRAKAENVYVRKSTRQRVLCYCCCYKKETVCKKRGGCSDCTHDRCAECLAYQTWGREMRTPPGTI